MLDVYKMADHDFFPYLLFQLKFKHFLAFDREFFSVAVPGSKCQVKFKSSFFIFCLKFTTFSNITLTLFKY